MHRYLKYGWLDNLDSVRHIRIGRIAGVAISVTPTIWLFPFVFVILRLVTYAPDKPLAPEPRLYDALVFSVGIAIFTLAHSFGHIASGKLAGNAMDELLFTATRAANIYRGDQSRIAARVHIARALGGPLANLLCAALCWALLPLAGGLAADVLNSTLTTSLFAGLFSFLPLPSIDGWVIWREFIRALRRERVQGQDA